MLFIDLTKAYDTVDRAMLWRVLLEELDIPQDLVAQLQQLYHHFKVQLVGDPMLSPITVRLGLKQGCPASPLLFSLFFDRVASAIQAAAANLNPTPHHFFSFLTLQLLILLFADDVALIARSLDGLASIYKAFRHFCNNNHLTINPTKTKAMVARDDNIGDTITLEGDTFDRVPTFTYLGAVIDEDGTPGSIVLHIVQRARSSFGALCEFVGTQRWTVPWTRLVLYDVYVRT